MDVPVSPQFLPPLLDELKTGLEAWRQLNSLYIASTTIMVLDWLLTLDLETSLIWRSRWNASKILYLIARYLPFVDIPVLLYHQFGYALPLNVCKITYEYQAWIFVIGSGFSELILTVRTWAVWEKDKRLTFGLFTIFILTTAAEFFLVGSYLNSSQHSVSPLPQFLGCVVETTSPNLAICFAVFMAFDGSILMLMIIRGISTFRSGGNSRLVRVVYGDGVIYYIYIFGLSLINLVIIYKLPSDYTTILTIMEGVIHSVVACRVILHIREQAHSQSQVLFSTQRYETGEHSYPTSRRSLKEGSVI